MTRTFMAGVALVALITGSVRAQDHQAPSVAGKWTMSVEAPAPHGAMTATLVLEQDDKKVTGQFVPGHGGEFRVDGEFVDRTLKLRTGSDDDTTTFTARLKDDGTLAGYISGPMGDMTWTAKRIASGGSRRQLSMF